MKCSISRWAAAVVLTAGASASVQAATVSFGFSDVDRLDLAGPQTEAGFTYEAVTGDSWELQNT